MVRVETELTGGRGLLWLVADGGEIDDALRQYELGEDADLMLVGAGRRALIGDQAMVDAFDTMFRAADTTATIMILGESGTGKSVAARAVHRRSPFAEKPFVTVSCPSLSI